MEFRRQISRRLHQEHEAVIALLAQFELALVRLTVPPPGPDDATWPILLPKLRAALRHEVTRHFQLEEEQLFPRLHQQGDGDLADLLAEEHTTIRAVAGPLLELIERAAQGGLDAAGWRSLKTHGLELAERLTSHAQKEEGALVPLVDDLLDEATDSAIAMEYAD